MPVIVFFAWMFIMSVAGGIGQTSCFAVMEQYNMKQMYPSYPTSYSSEELNQCLGENK